MTTKTVKIFDFEIDPNTAKWEDIEPELKKRNWYVTMCGGQVTFYGKTLEELRNVWLSEHERYEITFNREHTIERIDHRHRKPEPVEHDKLFICPKWPKMIDETVFKRKKGRWF